MTKVVDVRTTYQRVLVLQGAPRLTDPRGEYQPTALRYSWYSSDPTPRSVEVIVRKYRKDGRLGTTTSMKSFLLHQPLQSGWDLAPQWVRDLITTAA